MTRLPAIAFGLIGCIILVGTIYVFSFWMDRHGAFLAADTRLSDVRARRLDPREANAMRSALATPDPEAGLLLASSDAEAASRFQAEIQKASETYAIEELDLSIDQDATIDGVPALRATLRATVQDKKIGSFLRALEGGSPTIFIERMRLSRNPAAGDYDDPVLDMAATLKVYWDRRSLERSGS